MRAYSASAEEALRTRDFLKEWKSGGLLNAEQYERMERETVCDLRRTNIFLRLVLFVFTLIIVGAGVGLFFEVFLSHPGDRTIGVFLMIFAALCYAAAEFAVAKAQLYRYGIEEALAACSAGFLCAGIQMAFFGGLFSTRTPGSAEFLVPLAGVVASLWIWHRFGLPYAPVAAMLFTFWLASNWTPSRSGRLLITVAMYAAGLIVVGAMRPRYRLTYLNTEYSIAEALLWLGIYLTINLQLSQSELLSAWWRGSLTTSAAQFSRSFYWGTWVLTWCLPPVVLARGLRGKDRFVLAVGAISAILTLVTNKPYLGWQRHTWDPMLLGAFLTAVAAFMQRWLDRAPGGIRYGFTAQRPSGKDKRWLNVGVSAVGLVSTPIVASSPQQGSSAPQFGGGDSGGGGASSDF